MTSYMVRRFFLDAPDPVRHVGAHLLLLRLVPGNIADILFDSAGFIDPAEKAGLEKELGLDLPIASSTWKWISRLSAATSAISYVSEKPASKRSRRASRLPPSWRCCALFFSIILGVPLGVISAVRQDTALDYTLRVVSLSGLSLPSFWLALLILMALRALLGEIPIYTDTPETAWDEFLLLHASPRRRWASAPRRSSCA